VEQVKLVQEIGCFTDELEVVTCVSVLATTAPSRWMLRVLLIQCLECNERRRVGESGLQDHVLLYETSMLLGSSNLMGSLALVETIVGRAIVPLIGRRRCK
jgi:hypothetical protein